MQQLTAVLPGYNMLVHEIMGPLASLGCCCYPLLTFGKLTNACRGRNKRREESLGNTCPVAGRLHSISGDMAGNEDAALVLHDIHERGRAKKHQKTSKSQQMQTSADCFLEFIEG